MNFYHLLITAGNQDPYAFAGFLNKENISVMKIIIIYALAIQSGEAALLGRNRYILNLKSSSTTFKLHIHWQFISSLCISVSSHVK